MKRSNNKGEVLIMLIVSFLIVSLLAASAIRFAHIGLRISQSYAGYTGKAYLAEKALNIIKAGVETECSQMLSEEYERVLASYSYIPNSEKNVVFKEYYIKRLEDAYGENLHDTLSSYITNSGYLLAESPNAGGIYVLDNSLESEFSYDEKLAQLSGEEPTVEDDEETTHLYNRLTIKNVRVNYSQSDGASATVGADIVIIIPAIFDKLGEVSVLQSDYIDYVLVTDSDIRFDTGSTRSYIDGSMYAGEPGIVIGDHTNRVTVDAHSSFINTRGNIELHKGSSLSVDKRDSGACDLYANNIIVIDPRYTSAHITESGLTYDTYLNINANMNISDDLEVNTEQAQVNLAGSYLGYGNGSTESSSSSIIMNRGNSTLDVSSLRSLILAGRAFVSPAKSGFESDGITSVHSFPTAEGVSARFMQLAYLIPSVCMPDSLNPVQNVSHAEALELIPEILYENSGESGGLNLLDPRYNIDFSNPIIITIAGRYGTTLSYFYLNFGDNNSKNNYISDYIALNKEYLETKAESSLKEGRIVDDGSTSFITSGTVITYSDDDDGVAGLDLIRALDSSVDASISSISNVTRSKATSINSTLKYYQTDVLNDSLFNNIIDIRNLPTAVDTTKDYITPDGMSYRCIVHRIAASGVDGTYYIPDDMTSGLVIVQSNYVDGNGNNRGKVIIDHDFVGLIITNAKILVAPSASSRIRLMSNDPSSGEYPLLSLLMEVEGKEEVRAYFRSLSNGVIDTESGGNASPLDVQSLTRFENWVTY